MNNDELQKALLQAFSEEAPELLKKARSALLDMENNSSADLAEPLDRLKRSLHSLKGSSSAIGRVDLVDLSHHLETYLLSCNGVLDAAQLDLLHEGLAYIEAHMSAGGDSPMLAELLRALDETASAPQPAARPAAAGLPEPEPEPELVPLAAPSFSDSEVEPQAAVLAEVVRTPVLDETIRVSTRKINDIQASVGELIAFDLQQKDNISLLLGSDSLLADIMRNWVAIRHDVRGLQQSLPAQKAARLDARLAQFSSELKDIQHDFFRLRSQLNNQNAQFSLLVDEIGVNVRAVRMMPIVPFFESFRAVAREAARQLGKNVSVECVDSDIEVDRMVLEKVKDAMLHIVRNAVSHGIEGVEERLAAGKPEQGRIVLKAGFNGAFVTVSISDDGRGFDRQKLARKAVQMGLMKDGEALDDTRMLDLVCMPGFSTAETVNQLSGRGVGMDVVASVLTEIGGFLSLESRQGEGSSFSLNMPSTLANTQGLMVSVGDFRFGVVLDFVERIVRLRLDRLVEINGQSIFYLDDEPVAVTSLASVLQQPALEPDNALAVKPMLILKAGNQRLALIVDDVPGEIPMMVKSLGPQYERVDLYAGCTILSEGSVLAVLNVRSLLQQVGRFAALALVEKSQDPLLPAGGATENDVVTVLVVDDSITTRTLERNILEAENYRVLVATDGIEALELLHVENDVQLLVTDMEMPRMDGINLCREVRASRFAKLPIIMVTSVGNAQEKAKAMQAGADAYIIKHDFHQDHFLATVRRFVGHG
ncbi:MAG TPA: response regulator [Pseudomonadales bacterium]